MRFPDLQVQQDTFNSIRDDIDRELRETGFENYFAACGLDPSLGRLVVGRSFQYSTLLASLDADLDPLATRLETQHEVGLSIETSRETSSSRSYKGIMVSSALLGGPQVQVETEPMLDYVQFAVVEASITRLLRARRSNPFITKSLLKVDQAGD